jgi:hypothetical protein
MECPCDKSRQQYSQKLQVSGIAPDASVQLETPEGNHAENSIDRGKSYPGRIVMFGDF